MNPRNEREANLAMAGLMAQTPEQIEARIKRDARLAMNVPPLGETSHGLRNSFPVRVDAEHADLDPEDELLFGISHDSWKAAWIVVGIFLWSLLVYTVGVLIG